MKHTFLILGAVHIFPNQQDKIHPVSLPDGGGRRLDLGGTDGAFRVEWFNPREGGAPAKDATRKGGGVITLKAPDAKDDWLAVIRR